MNSPLERKADGKQVKMNKNEVKAISLVEQKTTQVSTALNNLYSKDVLQTSDRESSEYLFNVLNNMGDRNTKAIAFLVNHMKVTEQIGKLPELVAFVEETFKLKKTQFYDMIRVAEVFLKDGALSIFHDENGTDYSFTQLVKMLPRERSKKWSRVTLEDVKKLHESGEIHFGLSVKEIENVFLKNFTEVIEVKATETETETETETATETETETATETAIENNSGWHYTEMLKKAMNNPFEMSDFTGGIVETIMKYAKAMNETEDLLTKTDIAAECALFIREMFITE